jgi:hypothetical protein
MVNLVIGIYFHPEGYPPTLNAVTQLSNLFDSIKIVHRPLLKGDWCYPANTAAIASGRYMSSAEQEQSATIKKIGYFFQFVKDFYKACRKARPAVILLYDPIPLLAYKLVRPFLGFKHKLWYHNHDVADIHQLRKFSIGWFACKTERQMFRKLDLFTIPAASRLPSFPMDDLKGGYFVVPNYPSTKFYGQFRKQLRIEEEVKLIFQGRIGEGHGLESIVFLLREPIAGKKITLVLKGYCHLHYKQKLLQLAAKWDVKQSLVFEGYGPYSEVPRVASGCHIGIGIFSGKELMHLTLGTSSNKLYEYAALGLPVIYSREEYFIKYLGRYDWAIAADDNAGSIKSAIEHIIPQYEKLSASALSSFAEGLNFETSFKQVEDWITDHVVKKRGA